MLLPILAMLFLLTINCHASELSLLTKSYKETILEFVTLALENNEHWFGKTKFIVYNPYSENYSTWGKVSEIRKEVLRKIMEEKNYDYIPYYRKNNSSFIGALVIDAPSYEHMKKTLELESIEASIESIPESASIKLGNQPIRLRKLLSQGLDYSQKDTNNILIIRKTEYFSLEYTPASIPLIEITPADIDQISKGNYLFFVHNDTYILLVGSINYNVIQNDCNILSHTLY